MREKDNIREERRGVEREKIRREDRKERRGVGEGPRENKGRGERR